MKIILLKRWCCTSLALMLSWLCAAFVILRIASNHNSTNLALPHKVSWMKEEDLVEKTLYGLHTQIRLVLVTWLHPAYVTSHTLTLTGCRVVFTRAALCSWVYFYPTYCCPLLIFLDSWINIRFCITHVTHKIIISDFEIELDFNLK